MDHKDVIIQDLKAENKKLTEELKQLKSQPAAVDMDKLTKEMMEHICDNLCKHPNRVGITQEELDDICNNCKMGKFVCDILNTYNHQARQLTELKEESLDSVEMCEVKILIDEFLEYKRLEAQGLLIRKSFEIGGKAYIHQFDREGVLIPVQGAVLDIEEDSIRIQLADGRQLDIPKKSKGLFLTEQEAQSALEKMKGE